MGHGSLDTNVLLRLLLRDIPSQYDAVVNLISEPNAQIFVADAAIIETAFVLQRHYGFNRAQICEAIYGLMYLDSINCNRAVFVILLPFFVEHSALSFEDCYLVGHAQLNQAQPLWTFDKKLAKQVPAAQLIGL